MFFLFKAKQRFAHLLLILVLILFLNVLFSFRSVFQLFKRFCFISMSKQFDIEALLPKNCIIIDIPNEYGTERLPHNSVLYSYIGWLIDKLCTPSPPPHTLWLTHRLPQQVQGKGIGVVGGCVRGCVVGGSGGELFNLPPYVGVEHRIILAANAQCIFLFPFYCFPFCHL